MHEKSAGVVLAMAGSLVLAVVSLPGFPPESEPPGGAADAAPKDAAELQKPGGAYLRLYPESAGGRGTRKLLPFLTRLPSLTIGYNRTKPSAVRRSCRP